MTLEGPTQAEVPYLKGVEELFQVCLSDGSSFCATAGHRVLTPQGFLHVESLSPGQNLFSYAPILQESNLEHAPSNREPNALDSQKIASDYPGNCWPGSRLCGELLHSAIDTYRSSSPSQAGVLGHSPSDSFSGGSEMIGKYIHPCQHGDLPSSSDTMARFLELCNRAQTLLDPRMLERDASSYGSPSQFHSGMRSLWPFSELDPCSSNRQLACSTSSLIAQKRKTYRGDSCSHPLSELFHALERPAVPSRESLHGTERRDRLSVSIDSCLDLSACDFMVAQTKVVSIRKAGKRPFYDIHIPGPEHYFAEGTIHHNSGKTHNLTGWSLRCGGCAPLWSRASLSVPRR